MPRVSGSLTSNVLVSTSASSGCGRDGSTTYRGSGGGRSPGGLYLRAGSTSADQRRRTVSSQPLRDGGEGVGQCEEGHEGVERPGNSGENGKAD